GNLGVDSLTLPAFQYETYQKIDGKENRAHAAIRWGLPVMGLDPDEILGGKDGRPKNETEKAKEWLEAAPSNGPVKVSDLKTSWTAAGFSDKTIRNASDEIGVSKPNKGKNSTWALPHTAPQAATAEDTSNLL